MTIINVIILNTKGSIFLLLNCSFVICCTGIVSSVSTVTTSDEITLVDGYP